MISDTEFEEISNKSYAQAEQILATTDFEKYCNEMNAVQLEKLFWNLLKDYIEQKIPENTMTKICYEYEVDPTHHNMSREAKVALHECINLEHVTYFKIDEKKASEIRSNLKQDVSDYFGVWYKNFE